MNDICALCKNIDALEKSHIIPNAVFKRVKRSLSGKGILLTGDEQTWIKYSQDSWYEYLLCGECEDKVSKYEKYYFESIRGNNHVSKTENFRGITYSGIDYHKFKLFLTSLLWRAAIAKHDAFVNVILEDEWLEELRSSLVNEIPLGSSKYGCRLSKLCDSTLGFDDKNLEQFIISPIPRIKKRVVVILFIIDGVFIEFYCPFIPYKCIKKPGLFREEKLYRMPFQEINKIPELFNIMAESYSKHKKGMVKFKNR
jgi:hypothetical protein